MSRLTISENGSHLKRDGLPFVVVADTVWSAFADATLSEWRSYLRFRANQGFNTALVSILPILHDRAVRDDAREPFETDRDGHYLFDKPSGDYFATAKQMAAMAREEGITLGLVVLWLNYVPGTWGAERTPWAVMGEGQRNEYIALVTKTFAEFDPMFIVSGDEHFRDEEPIAVYADALARVKAAAPECLTTLHSTPVCDLPPVLADSENLDFYCYQAGHDHERQDRTWELAELYLGKAVRRPTIDFEPCYEGHGYGAGAGRFLTHHIRSATWWSIAGGASAGIGYGAHGVWQWYRRGARFTSPDFSSQPFARETAMSFPGADDVAFAGAIVADHALYETGPRQDLLVDPYPGLRACATEGLDTIAIYLPDARDVELRVDLAGYSLSVWGLEHRSRLTPRLRPLGENTVIEQLDVLGDALIIAQR